MVFTASLAANCSEMDYKTGGCGGAGGTRGLCESKEAMTIHSKNYGSATAL